MNFVLPIVLFLVKNAPTMELIGAYFVKDWQAWREQQRKDIAAQLVKQAVALSSTDHVNKCLNGGGC